jgi:5-methylcytosine-specific restriction endonuclease McrA
VRRKPGLALWWLERDNKDIDLPQEGGVFNSRAAAALILNSGYQPVKVVCWQKAIVLWLQGKVEVLEFHEQTVSSPSRTFLLPSVIRLKNYMRPYFSMTVRLSRQNVFIRDQLTCQYCLKQISEKRLTIDHVLPLSKGGQHEWTNVVAACSSCNNRKGNRTPEQANMRLLRAPVRPKWLPSHELDMRPERMPSVWEPYLKVIRGWS